MHYIHFFSTLSETVRHIAVGGGYTALFVIMFLEGLPLIGMAIPGHVAIITAGFLAAAGVMDPVWVGLNGIAGALLGDCASFFLGRRYGWPLLERLRPHFFVAGSVLEKARAMLERHVGKSLVIGRFNPVTRGIMPFLVGANRSKVKSFWIYDAAGTVAWIFTSIVIGYAISFGYQAAAGFIGKLAVVAVIAALLIIWGYRFVNARFHIFKRYELFVLMMNLASLYGLARTLQDAYSTRPFMAGFDIWVNSLMSALEASVYGGFLVPMSVFMNAYAGPIAVSAITVAFGIWLSARRKWRSAAILLLSVGLAAVSVGWLKDIFMRVRPSDLMLPALAGDPSFPSGHAAFSAALFVVVAYIAAPKFKKWVTREIFIAACVLVPILVGLSRLVLNVHWASDVLAGWSLGVFCATASILFVRYVGALIVNRV
ncbi:MAG: bifunctional DedA family/phosphatase PAP2 family protein [Patescibacteria group bacterium]|nr:bifunctional DedA family/phosphatase PAP2 family protein [Patescibacteria group bacterium]